MSVDKTKIAILRGELTKVRCWMTGYKAGVGNGPHGLGPTLPGEDSLRQTIQFLDELAKER